MSYTIDEIEGIGPASKEKLNGAGIKNTEDFLSMCGEKKGREAIAEQTGLSEKHLLRWANMADMMRIKGVGGQFAELLEAAGVDTVKELRHRNAENLAAAMDKANAEKNLANAAPSANQVGAWIEQAKQLDPKISH